MTSLRTAKADLTGKQNNSFLYLDTVVALLHILCKVILPASVENVYINEILEIKMLSVNWVSGTLLSA